MRADVDYARRPGVAIEAEVDARAELENARRAANEAHAELQDARASGDAGRIAEAERLAERAAEAVHKAVDTRAEAAGTIAALDRERDYVEKGY